MLRAFVLSIFSQGKPECLCFCVVSFLADDGLRVAACSNLFSMLFMPLLVARRMVDMPTLFTAASSSRRPRPRAASRGLCLLCRGEYQQRPICCPSALAQLLPSAVPVQDKVALCTSARPPRTRNHRAARAGVRVGHELRAGERSLRRPPASSRIRLTMAEAGWKSEKSEAVEMHVTVTTSPRRGWPSV